MFSGISAAGLGVSTPCFCGSPQRTLGFFPAGFQEETKQISSGVVSGFRGLYVAVFRISSFLSSMRFRCQGRELYTQRSQQSFKEGFLIMSSTSPDEISETFFSSLQLVRDEDQGLFFARLFGEGMPQKVPILRRRQTHVSCEKGLLRLHRQSPFRL